jgi:hypothetical protein
VTKVSTVETIAIEKFFVPGKWLSSLSKSISSRLMMLFSSEYIVGMFYRQRMLVIDGKYNNDDGLSIGA